jgi:type I restriction enzyme S subunit
MRDEQVLRGWPSVELRRLVRTVGGLTPSKEEPAFWGGDVPWVSPKDMKTFRIVGSVDSVTRAALKRSGIALVEPGAVLMVTRGMILDHTVPVAINVIPVTINQDMKALVCTKRLRSSYLAWALLGHQDELLASVEIAGHGTCALRTDQWGALRLGLPPLEEQAQIARFLDYETARIDALLEKQQQLIALLKEKRQAVISHAVTKGLNPDAPLRDSGVDWLGMVPAHWDVIPLKHVCALIKDGTHLPPPRVDAGVPLLSVRNLQNGEFRLRDDDSMISERAYAELCRSFVPKTGDVFMAIVGATLGKVAVVPHLPRFHIQRSIALLRPQVSAIEGRYLAATLSSSGFQSLLWQNVGFSAQPGIYLETVGNFRVPRPPLLEQKAINVQLADKVGKLELLIDKAEQSVELMTERRTALISAAVTGKIDVRGWVPPESQMETAGA